MHVLVIDHALPDSRNQGVLEISRFLCMLFLSVRAGSQTTQCVASVLPSSYSE
jgi:hypothetical protein